MQKKPMIALLLASLLASLAAAQGARPSDLESELRWLQSPGAIENTALRWFQFTDIWTAIQASSKSRLPSATVMAALAPLGLPESQARSVIAMLSEASWLTSDPIPTEENREERRSQLETVFPPLLEVYLSAPSNPAVAQLLKNFFAAAGADRHRFEERFMDCFRRLDDPAQAALAYSQSDRTSDFMLERLVGTALTLQPRHPLLLLALAEEDRLHSDAIARSAFFEATYRIVQASGRADDNLLRLIGQRWVQALLEAGLAARAVATLTSFPTELRQSLEAGDHGSVTLRWEGASRPFELRDIALDIACIYLLEGHHASAEEVLAKYRVEAHSGPKSQPPNKLERQRRRLELTRVVAGLETPSDAFDFVASLFDAGLGDTGLRNGTLQPLPWRLLLADYLRSSGIAGLADNLTGDAALDLASLISAPQDGRRSLQAHPSSLRLAGLATFSPIEEELRVDASQLRNRLRQGLDRQAGGRPVEDRLVRDPDAPGTDGDGRSDGADSMPPIDRGPPDLVRTAALRRPLESLTGRGQGTLYLVADPSDIRGVQIDKRVVVLSREEARLLKSKFPATFVAELPVVLFDAGMERCLVVWTSERRGGSYRMRRIGEAWTVESVSDWAACG